jgi:hypothetical protein
MLGREEKRDVDRRAGEDRLLDRLSPGGGARDLDEDVAVGALVEIGNLRDGRLRIVRQQRGDLERNPAIDFVGAFVDRLEHSRGVAQVGDRQLEEGLLRLQASVL